MFCYVLDVAMSMLNTVRDLNVSTLNESKENLNSVWTCLHDWNRLFFVYPTIKNGGLKVCYKILSIRDFEGYEKYSCMKVSLYVYPVK